jgi:hypothetical protein
VAVDMANRRSGPTGTGFWRPNSVSKMLMVPPGIAPKRRRSLFRG